MVCREKVESFEHMAQVEQDAVLQVGRRKFLKLVASSDAEGR